MTRAFISLTILAALPWPARAENWPGWRGPTGMGISSEKNLPVRWSAKDNVRWKVPVPGAGVSAPVVWGEHVFLTASDGRLNDRLHVYAFNRSDGKQLWHTKLFGTAPTDLFAPGGMAVPTPITDGKRLYVLFGTGDLFSLDFDGKPVWVRSLAQEYGPFRNRWGMGTSPILVDNLLVVQVDHWSQSYLLGVDPATGENRWKTDRNASVNWSSPAAVKVNGQTELIVQGTYRAMGYDASTGSELWTVRGMGMQCIPSPAVDNGMLFSSSGESTMAIKLDGKTGDLTKTNVAWTNPKATAFIGSPLVYQGYVYIGGDRGIGQCLDARNGKVVWKKRLGDHFHASPIAGDGKVYFTASEGIVRVVRAGREGEILSENNIGEAIVASPAISNGRIFIRGDKHLFCIEQYQN